MIRENLVTSAVNFLNNPAAANSPLDRRLAFLRAKGLNQEEIDAALVRAGQQSASTSSSADAANSRSSPSAYPPGFQQLQQQGSYNGYQPGYWQQQRRPELPTRDWRDWFIMATITSGLGYGLYALAKRYIYPLIAPPTPAQLQQDKEAIDEQFDRAFALLEQLNADTQALKASEQARTERLDKALQEVEKVVGELKETGLRREDDVRRLNSDMRSVKDLMQKGLEAQKDSADGKLKELHTELRGVKVLIANRMTMAGKLAASATEKGSSGTSVNGDSQNKGGPVAGSETTPTGGTSESKEGSSTPAPQVNRAVIPAWQMAAASKDGSASSQQS
ncbi:MAG: hypothetical protein M1823_005579 [Watsoniomyces obsoletus]|nr:MAG: hypothetical protein M1823_005579 [Watsoniomyces obsoletus]